MNGIDKNGTTCLKDNCETMLLNIYQNSVQWCKRSHNGKRAIPRGFKESQKVSFYDFDKINKYIYERGALIGKLNYLLVFLK